MASSDEIETDQMCRSDVEERYYEEYQVDMDLECVAEQNMHERLEKRKEPDDEGEWTIYKSKSKEKKYKKEAEKIEIYISSNEPLPKQFALAKLLKDNYITEIERVKYLGPFKIRLDVLNELSAHKLETCKNILDKGWRIQRAMEKNFSYGVIRDVDIDMKDEEILNNITCPLPAELTSIFRLNRRSAKDGWSPSESVRLCFKGACLPAYVYVEGLRIRVDPYVFPVSQCSRCWKLGHMTKKCPSNKVVCPKCGENHPNCETTTFKCTNCEGTHMAMYKGCPAFLKEKRLREIMAEFNCTYRKALTAYVAPGSPVTAKPTLFTFNPKITSASFPPLEQNRNMAQFVGTTPVNVLQTRAEIHQEEQSNETQWLPSRKRRNRSRKEGEPFNFESVINQDPQKTPALESGQKRAKEVNFSELIDRLKEIIFIRDASLQIKMKKVLRCCVEWLILIAVDNISDWPILKRVLDYFIDG